MTIPGRIFVIDPVYIYLYLYMSVYVCVYMYVYIYIYIYFLSGFISEGQCISQ